MSVDEVRKLLDQTANYNVNIMCLKEELVELKDTKFEDDIKKEIEEQTEFVMNVRKSINKINQPKIRNIMRMRYLNGMTYVDIAKKLHLTYQWTYELHKRGIKILSEVME